MFRKSWLYVYEMDMLESAHARLFSYAVFNASLLNIKKNRQTIDDGASRRAKEYVYVCVCFVCEDRQLSSMCGFVYGPK